LHELAINSKNKNITDLYRGINEFKKGYKPRNNLVMGKNGDVLADSHNIINRWKSYFSQLFNVHNVSDVRLIKIHTAKPVVPGPTHLDVEIAIAKMKKYNSPGSDLFLPEVIQEGGETLVSVTDKLINAIWDKEEIPVQ
jgi:hypothetical protein